MLGDRDGASSVDGDAESVREEDSTADSTSKGGVFQRLHDEVGLVLYLLYLKQVAVLTPLGVVLMVDILCVVLCYCCLYVIWCYCVLCYVVAAACVGQARSLRERLKEKRQQIIAETGETFAPAISDRSRQLASGASGDTVYERLHTDGKRVDETLAAKRRAKQLAELEQCTFAPRTNTAARRSGAEPPVRGSFPHFS